MYSHLSCLGGGVAVLEEQDLAAEFVETSVGLKLSEQINERTLSCIRIVYCWIGRGFLL